MSGLSSICKLNSKEAMPQLVGLIGALLERMDNMAIKLDGLTAVVNNLDLVTRTKLAEFLAKYDALQKENAQLRLQLADQLKIDEQTQADISSQIKAIAGVIDAVENFGKSL